MKILIAEDEAIIAESLYMVLSDLGYSPLEPCQNSEDAIKEIEKSNPELALVDIHIGEQFSGFKVAKKLQQNNIPFVFVTALYDKETVQKASEYNPAAYLVKPFNKENLFTTIELANSNKITKVKNNTASFKNIFIKDGNTEVNIISQEIAHVESAGGYINIVLVTGKKHLIKSTLQEFLTHHKIETIIQVHKSYLVNTTHIKAIKYDELLVHETTIPIGRAYKNNIKENLNLG
jgi:two-component system, LytTR family, response regulator LytT